MKKILIDYHGYSLRYSKRAHILNDFTAQCGTYYTTTTPFFERALK